jgi:hypothetical protein
MAGPTRLELATSCVTGRRSNRLNYGPAVEILDWWAVRDLNTRPSGCKPVPGKLYHTRSAPISAYQFSGFRAVSLIRVIGPELL